MKKDLYTLKIDKEFKQLIRPLTKDEYAQLKASLLADGCREPIATWTDIIVDGHNRYEICTDNRIPFAVTEMYFDSREDVIKWICANQLGRRNITEETRKYLIGKQYETEKVLNTRRNANGYNQYKKADKKVPYGKVVVEVEKTPAESSHKTAMRIAEENRVSECTVQKYGLYSRALEKIGEKAPQLVPKILSGKYKISHSNILELAELSADEINRIVERIEAKEKDFVRYSKSKQEIDESVYGKDTRFKPQEPKGPSIKDMPAYDPDAEATGLALTIPTWTSSVDRIISKTNFQTVSENAKIKLQEVIANHMRKSEELLLLIREK